MNSNQKIKIYIFHPYSGEGGADLSISRLINGLNDKKYDIEFLSISSPMIKKKINKKIKYFKINAERTLYSFKQIKDHIAKDKKNYKKKIFISNQYFANVLSLIFLRSIHGIKIVLLERNHLDEFKYHNGIFDLCKKNCIKLLIKLFYNKADLIIGNSFNLSNSLQKFINRKVKTIYNPCYFPQLRTKRKNFLNKKKIILNVARLEKQKDHLTLLKAVKNLKNKNNLKLILIGYGSLFLKIKNYIKINNLNDIVEIHTNVKDVAKFYSRTDLFILSSLYEGFPNVLVEAAQYNIPIISTNCNSGPREILSNGKGGELLATKDYLTMSKKIESFLKNEKPFIKKANFCKKNLYRFNNKHNLMKFENFFDKL